MPRAHWTPQAVADIDDIAYYIAKTDHKAATAGRAPSAGVGTHYPSCANNCPEGAAT